MYVNEQSCCIGDVEAAIADGYVGAEWWTQSRGNEDPKEYHMDTAISWYVGMIHTYIHTKREI